jgi:hypothetical protein
MAIELDLPLCLGPLPDPKKFEIPLPFGGALKPLVDMSKGLPSDCELVHSLMIQLTPMLSGMECVLRILKVIMALKELLTSLPDLSKVGDVVKAIEELAECFIMLTPAGIGKLIAAVLRIIIAYLNCFISAFMSIYTFQLGLDFSSASGNPVLLNSLNCAKNNAQKSMDGLSNTMEGVQPLFDLLTLLGSIGGLQLKLPSLSDIAGNEDPLQAIEQLKSTLEELQQIADSLPV